MSHPTSHVDEAILDYADAGRDLRELAAAAGKDGWTEWATEILGYAGIAERAAEAEATNPEWGPARCGICHGLRACDLTAHRARVS